VARLRLRSDLLLVFTCLGLYIGAAAQARTARGTALSVGLNAAARPFLMVADGLGSAWEIFWLGEKSLYGTVAELQRRREEADALRRSNQVLTAEVAALRQGSQLLRTFPSLSEHAVLARVIGRDVLLSHTLVLDRGSQDGVRLDCPVLGAGGLLGRVDRILTRTARVQLLSHPAAAAAARVAGQSIEGLLMGGDPPKLTGLPPYTQVAAGIPVVSAGSEGIYPPGLLVGVTGEARNEGLFTVVPVRLAAPPTEALVVLVLVSEQAAKP
jgi:cell shape-determining protein MreC